MAILNKITNLNGFKETEIGMIPEDWEVAKFENLVIGGKNNVGKIKQSSYKIFGKYPIVDQGKNFIAGYCDDANLVYKGQLPVVIFGDHTRIFKFVDFPFISGADGTKILQPNTNLINPLYFYFALTNLDIPSRGYNRHYALLREKFIPLPPLPEQKKIVAVLSAVQEAKEKTEEVIRAAKELKKSLLEYLFTYGPVSPEQAGNVTLKETEIGMIPEDWEVVKLKELHLDVSDGNYGEKYPRQSEFIDSGIPFIRANNIRDLKITWKDMRYISEEKHEFLQKGHLKFNDILITTRGEIGQVAFVDEEFVDCNINAQIVRINTKDKIISKFFLYCLACEKSQAQFYELKTGSTLQQLPVGRLLGLKVPLPPFDEQQKIAEILSAVDKKIEAEENKKKSLEDLFKTLLNNLMTGKIRVNNLEV
jgi:type I restriction enzyme S subunit